MPPRGWCSGRRLGRRAILRPLVSFSRELAGDQCAATFGIHLLMRIKNTTTATAYAAAKLPTIPRSNPQPGIPRVLSAWYGTTTGQA